MKIILATKNKGKLLEYARLLSDIFEEVFSMEDYGINLDVLEDGETFEENARLKAIAISEATGEICVSDDSGLEVDFLDRNPGIHTSRFAGENASYNEKFKLLLKLLEGVPFEKRTARFVCVICCIFPNGDEFTVRGECEGFIGFEPKGENGFGYDPIFYIDKNTSFAQISAVKKDKLSHRGKASRQFLEILKEKLEKRINH